MIVALCALLVAAEPMTLDELKQQVPAGDRRTQAMVRFARDPRPTLMERMKAVRDARRKLSGAARVDALLLEAKVAAIAGRISTRKTALQTAASSTTGAQQRLINDVLAADTTVQNLLWHVRRREEQMAKAQAAAAAAQNTAAPKTPMNVDAGVRASPPPLFVPLDDETTRLVEATEKTLPTYKAFNDERAAILAEVAMARAEATAEHAGAALLKRFDELAERARGRDLSGARKEALLCRARLLFFLGRTEEGTLDRVRADRAGGVALDEIATDAPARYSRTKEGQALCRALRDTKGAQSCASFEKKQFGDRTFYDFSVEKGVAFDNARADDVLAEYEALIHDCLKVGAKDGLTQNTHLEIEWAVGTDGRVRSFILFPTRLRGSTVDACLDEALQLFRYPKYKGEMQHVRVTFDVGE